MAELTQASASGRLLEFEHDMAPVYKAQALAMAAVQCSLRSEGWLRSIIYSAGEFLRGEVQRRGLTPNEIDAADAFGDRTARSVFQELSCASLVNSSTMDELDKLQYRVTGGFH